MRRPRTAPPPIPKAKHSPRSREGMAEIEQLQRRDTVGKLLAVGMSNDAIREVMTKQYGMSISACDAMARKVRSEWRVQHEGNQAYYRAEQVERIRRLITMENAKPSPNLTALARLEDLFARIVGNYAPMRVQVNVDATISETFVQLAMSMSASDRDAIIREQYVLEQQASAYNNGKN